MNTHESFKHSLVASKLWLCEHIEHAIHAQVITNPIVHILAGWDNLLGFMMAIRKPKLYGTIYNYDISHEHIDMANSLTDHWMYEYPKFYNQVADIKNLKFNVDSKAVFVNCSIDQLDNTEWYGVIPSGSLVCLQCTDLPINHDGWDIKQSHTLEGLTKTYPLEKVIFAGTLPFNYSHLSFNRHMIIGIK